MEVACWSSWVALSPWLSFPAPLLHLLWIPQIFPTAFLLLLIDKLSLKTQQVSAANAKATPVRKTGRLSAISASSATFPAPLPAVSSQLCKQNTCCCLSFLSRPYPQQITKISSNFSFPNSFHYPSFQHQQAFPENTSAAKAGEKVHRKFPTQAPHPLNIQRGNGTKPAIST